jgi:hypothetical protein
MENKTAKTWKDKYLPNLFVHHFIGAENKQWIDNEIAHTHPWNTVSIVIKGGYVEEENYNGVPKVANAPAIVPRSWKTSHRFTQVTPNTWTLWFHGIRKKTGKWAFDIRVHEVVCPACVKYNNGVCMNTTKPQELADRFPVSTDTPKWRETTWMKCDDDLDNIIIARKRAIQKAKIKVPATLNERFELTRDFFVKQNGNPNAEVSKV